MVFVSAKGEEKIIQNKDFTIFPPDVTVICIQMPIILIPTFPFLGGQGVPMIYMGDEYGHTKGGNNNTYCHDNYVIP